MNIISKRKGWKYHNSYLLFGNVVGDFFEDRKHGKREGYVM